MDQSKCSKFLPPVTMYNSHLPRMEFKHFRIHLTYLEFLRQLLWFLQLAPQHCQQRYHKSVYHMTLEIKIKTGWVGWANRLHGHHVRSTVEQMWQLSSYEHFGCNKQGLHGVGTTLSDVPMQKSVRFLKVVAILAPERASSYVRLDKMVTNKVRWGDLLQYRPKHYPKSSLWSTTSYCMWALLRPHMDVMRVENFFPCEGCLIGKQCFNREKGIYSTLSKILLFKSNTRSI